MTFRMLLPGILALSLLSCARREGAENDLPAAAQTATVVPVTTASRADLSTAMVLTAEFRPFQEVELMSKVAGFVKAIHVDIGDHVRSGQLLATLEVPEMANEATKASAAADQATAEIAAAADDLRRAESAHDMAHLSFTRLSDVSKREPGLVPRQEVDEVHSKDLVSEAQVAAAKSHLQAAQQLSRAAQAEQARLQTLFEYTSITAPFAGTITKRYANTGAMIQAGTSSQQQAMPLVRLAQVNVLRLILPVPESAVPKVRIGAPVDVRVPSLRRTFPGRVARFTGSVSESTRTMDTEVDVPNPSLALVPGMYAEVDLTTDQKTGALSLPLDAVERNGTDSRVFEVTQAGTVHVLPVTLGMETAQRVEIQSGVEEGAMVITGRHTGLKEGDHVQPKPEAVSAAKRG